MADLTVSATIDSFMGAADAAAARSAIGANDAANLNTGTLDVQRLPWGVERQTYKRETFLYDECYGTTAGGPIGLQSTNAGGTWSNTATPDNARCGVARASTGATAATNQRGGAHTGAPGTAPPIMFGGAFYECCFSAAPALSLFDGTVTGAILIGYGAGVSSPIDGAYFRSTDGGNWFAVTRENGNETFTDTGVAPTLGTFRNFRIQVEADRSAVRFYIDGTLVATHTTNIPIATRGLSHVFTVNRVAAVATAVGMDLDFLWTRRVLSADRWS